MEIDIRALQKWGVSFNWEYRVEIYKILSIAASTMMYCAIYRYMFQATIHDVSLNCCMHLSHPTPVRSGPDIARTS